jgi:hypothetical protein
MPRATRKKGGPSPCEPKRPPGRPTDYTPDFGELICRRMIKPESIQSICRDPEMPAESTIYLWRLRHAEFSEMYARAREVQGHRYADEALEIADEVEPEAEAIQKAKLQVDLRKWMAARLAPRDFGDKVALTGGDGGAIRTESSQVLVYLPSNGREAAGGGS